MRKAACLAPILASILSAAPAWPGPAPSARIHITYDPPRGTDAAEIYRELKSRRVLEGLRVIIESVRLPRSLTLRMSACNGDPNAWYAPESRTVTVCYEYVQDVQNRAPAIASPDGVARKDAIFGPVAQVFLHETGHALIDLLDLPILGREEDAADQFAALVVLELPPAQARRIIDGSAHLFRSLGAEEIATAEALADDHGLLMQRLYNLLCLAYGSDKRAFAYLVDAGHLPRSRAKLCASDYDEAAFAIGRLFQQHLRRGRMERAQVRRAFRWIF